MCTKMSQLQQKLLAAKQLVQTCQNEDLHLLKLKQEFLDGEDCIAQKKSQYSLLKYGLAEVEAKVSFLRNLKEDRDDWSHPDDADKHLDDVTSRLKVAKEKNSDTKEEIAQMTETAADALAKLDSKVQELKNKIEQLENRRAALNEKKKQEGTKKMHSMTEKKAQEAKLAALEESCQTLGRVIALSTAELERMKVIHGNRKKQRALLQETVTSRRETCRSTKKSMVKCHERALDTLRGLNAFKRMQIHYYNGSKLVIEFLRDGEPDIRTSEQPGTHNNGLVLCLELKQRDDESVLITNAMVTLDNFPIDELLEAQRSCLPAFVHSVQEKWQEYCADTSPMDTV
ncbi:uncharacterized protein LOC135474032 [Liolophura sinensis]|uniref:uncharacterized protein LOC135474032 n=1 Tax=Liolophura sinensis TaxID=3198878 RepID=UPI0031582FDC